MEFLVLIVIVIVLMFGVGGWLAIYLIAASGRSRKRAEANAPAILDAAFDGRPDVVFKINMESPTYETVVLGAKKRGYRMANETNDTADGDAKTLIFEKVN